LLLLLLFPAGGIAKWKVREPVRGTRRRVIDIDIARVRVRTYMNYVYAYDVNAHG